MKTEFHPFAVSGKMAASGDDTEIEVTIAGNSVRTTFGAVKDATSDVSNGIARDQLRSFVERIERLEEEKKTVADDIKDVYGEAKSTGLRPKTIRQVISIRKQDPAERAEAEAMLETYLLALGMI